jgi:predicted nucleic acid-binding protein
LTCYWDTSALLALLIQEPGTPAARALARKDWGLPGYTSFFTLIELESSLTRRLMEGSLAEQDLPRVRLQAQRLERSLGLVWADEPLVDAARRIVLEFGLRPGDGLQLASARLVTGQDSACVFASLDQKLNEAAQAAGLRLAL